jgi:hypothetical protein
VYTVQEFSQTLQQVPLLDGFISAISGYFDLTRIIATTHGQKKVPVLFFYGLVKEFLWDPGRFSWSDQTGFLDYSTTKGRAILKARHPPLQLAITKWPHALFQDFRFP